MIVMAFAPAAMAGTATTQMHVQTTVVSGCSVSAAPFAFGNYTPGQGAVAATSLIKIACTAGTIFGVGLNGGTTAGGTIAQRLLGNGSYTLQYNLYTSSAYSVVWGDGSGTSQVRIGTGTGVGTPVTWTLYGLLPDNATNQAAAMGNYSDTVLVVMTY
jgi:spore coat protein U-like protein